MWTSNALPWAGDDIREKKRRGGGEKIPSYQGLGAFTLLSRSKGEEKKEKEKNLGSRQTAE